MSLKKSIKLSMFITLFFCFGCGQQSSFEKALSYQNDAEYNKAIGFYKLAIKKGERVAESEKNIGDICFGGKKYDEAFLHYKNSIEIDSSVALETVMKYISYNNAHVRNLVGDIFLQIENEESNNQINEALAKILNSGDQYKILDALSVISRMKGKCVSILGDIIKLLDGNNIIKQKVLEILPDFANVINDEDFNKIVNLLSQNDEIIKTDTINCLGKMKTYGIKAFPSLLDIAINEPNYKEQAFSAIEKMGRPTKTQVEKLYPTLKDKPKEIKIKILNIFDKHSDGANIYVPYLMYFLNDEDSEIKQVTRKILSKIGKASSDTVSELIKLLDEKNEEIVSRAVYELGDIGKAASDAIEPLKKIAETTTSKDIRKLANDALQKIQ